MFFQKGTRQVWRLFGALVGLIIVVVAVWGRLGGLDRAGTLEIGQIRPVDGRMYSIAPPPARFPFVSPQDSVAAPFASNLRLFESGHQLGPAHSLHVAIQDSGRGAYSHWNSALLFSTGDNSDPTKNGRSYSFSRTIFLNPWIAAGLILLGGLLGWPAIADFSRRENIKGRLAAIFAAPRTTARLVIAYILLLCVPAVLLFLAIGARTAPQTIAAFGANRPLTDRIAAYLQDPKPYSAIFLGDSRTYCDIHPELLESFVPGMHALNLSNFSNWFPTQLGVVREIANRIPPGTQVIWSIGHQNFSSSRIPVVYPIGFADALRLTWWNAGKAPNGLSDNLYHYH